VFFPEFAEVVSWHGKDYTSLLASINYCVGFVGA
jgi:predicted RNase H-like HicB family nuclease